MNSIWTLKWWKAAGERALRTFAQVLLSMLTVGQAVTEVDWLGCLSIAATGAIISVLTSIVAGIPEAKELSSDKKDE